MWWSSTLSMALAAISAPPAFPFRMAASRWERDTVALAREGRPGAYAKLVHCYTEPIGHAVQKIVRDQDRASDVTQQAFVSAYEHLDSYDPRHRFFSWIYRIALNEALNAARRSRRCCRLDGMEMPDPDPSPEELLIARERAAGLRRALKELPGKYQHLVILRYFLDLPYADIACILDLPVTTVKSRLHYGRRALKKHFGLEEKPIPRVGYEAT